ncbi:hypothetical protein MauCBS54593_001377 [Microsporum audouinii]
MVKMKKSKNTLSNSESTTKIEPEPEIARGENMEKDGRTVFHESLTSYFVSSKFSDLVITTVDQQHKVHKLVVCGQSEVFSRMLDRDWKESSENTIELGDDDPRAIEAMISFMYKFDYHQTGGEASSMLFDAKVFGVAEKYGIAALKICAQNKFKVAIQIGWNTDEFLDVIAEVYNEISCADRTLRKLLATVCYDNIRELFKKDHFKVLLEDIPGFAADVIHLFMSKLREYACPSCSTRLKGPTGTCSACGRYHQNLSPL